MADENDDDKFDLELPPRTIEPTREINFDTPNHMWVVEYRETGETDIEEMSIFEYEKTLTLDDVMEEVRFSFLAFEKDRTKTLEELGIELISARREEC